MTTIAYNHKAKQIAVDGRSTRNDRIVNDDTEKFIRDEGDIYFFAGSVCDQVRMIELIKTGKTSGSPKICCTAMRVTSDGQVETWGVDDDGYPFCEVPDCNEAMGSGADFAIAAMDMGKSTADAVRYASTRDIFTGGTVRLFDIEFGVFIDAN